jgi:hypothetical protein
MPQALETFRKVRFGGHLWDFGYGLISDTDAAQVILSHWGAHGGGDIEQYGEALITGSAQGAEPWYPVAFSAVMIRGFELAMQQNVGEPAMCQLWRELYRPFAREVGSHADILLSSVNYDLLVDQALLHEGLCPDYGLDPTYVKEINAHHKAGNLIPYLKPNGSMNWFVCTQDRCRILTLKWERGATTDCPSNWGTGRERHCDHLPDPTKETILRFLLVPPGLKVTAHRPSQLRTVYERFEVAVRTAKDIFFLGWSAPDTDKEWASSVFSSCSARYVVINRDDQDSLKDRYHAVLPTGSKIEWFLGETKGDISGYQTSEWRSRLLR